MKKIYYILFAMMMVAAFSSCDKDADHVKMETVVGTYTGDIMASLYIPDYATEIYMLFAEGDINGNIATDIYRNGEVDFNFSSDNKATFCVNHLDTVNFSIRFFEDDIDYEGHYEVRDIYKLGAFASMFYMVDSLMSNSIISYAEYEKFASMMTVLEDTIEFSKIASNPLQMKESGAIYTTYDFEQNSFIERVNLADFDFTRRTNAVKFIKYAEDNFLSLLAPIHKQQFLKIKDNLKLSGTVKNAEGTCAVTYSNYHAMLMLVVTKADGIIDVLKDALTGPYKVSSFGYIVADEDGNPAPSQLWFEVNYQGDLSNISNWKEIGDK